MQVIVLMKIAISVMRMSVMIKLMKIMVKTVILIKGVMGKVVIYMIEMYIHGKSNVHSWEKW